MDSCSRGVRLGLALSFLLLCNSTSAIAQECDPTPDPDNLIYNGHFECEGTNPELPDGWTRSGATSATNAIWLAAGAAPTGGNHDGSRALQVVSTVAASSDPLWRLIDSVTLEPDTWYEFSVDMASDGAELNILPPDDPKQPDGAARSSYWNGIHVDIRYNTNGENERIQQPGLNTTQPGVMDDFDPDAGVYRTHKTGGYAPWRRFKGVFRTTHWEPEDIVLARISTHHYPVGTTYLDNVVLKKTQPNVDTTIPALPETGTLHFVQHAGSDFFPIVAWGNPKVSGSEIFPDDYATWRSLVGSGFNTSGYSSAALAGQRSILEAWPGDLGLVFHFGNPYWMSSGGPEGGPSVWWRDDPGHLYPWDAPQDLQDTLDFLKSLGTPPAAANTAARDNLIFVLALDEETCHPAELGANLAQLEVFSAARDQLHAPENFPAVPVISNFCGGAGSSGGVYTGDATDLIPYLEVADVFTQTSNLPAAYSGDPLSHRERILDLVGAGVRRSLQNAAIASAGGAAKPQLAFGIGVPEWTRWDGASDNFLAAQYLPYNLQRFLLYSQLINGATGVWIHFSAHVDVSDPRDATFLDQVRHLTEEIAGLKAVLLVPSYNNRPVSISDPRVEYMLKHYAGKGYLFTAANHFEDLPNVQITLADFTVTKVTALGEVQNGDYANPVNEIICEGDCNAFSDDFVGEDGSAGQHIPTPGYAVHVYELELMPEVPAIPLPGLLLLGALLVLGGARYLASSTERGRW